MTFVLRTKETSLRLLETTRFTKIVILSKSTMEVLSIILFKMVTTIVTGSILHYFLMVSLFM